MRELYYNRPLRVMPYNEDLKENFIDFFKPNSAPVLILVAILIIFILFFML